MGNKRLEPEEKKISLKLTIKKKYIDELKSRQINISRLFEDFVEKYLNK